MPLLMRQSVYLLRALKATHQPPLKTQLNNWTSKHRYSRRAGWTILSARHSRATLWMRYNRKIMPKIVFYRMSHYALKVRYTTQMKVSQFWMLPCVTVSKLNMPVRNHVPAQPVTVSSVKGLTPSARAVSWKMTCWTKPGDSSRKAV